MSAESPYHSIHKLTQSDSPLPLPREIVVKQYDAVVGGLPFFSGATVLSNGAPSLILDVSSLVSAA